MDKLKLLIKGQEKETYSIHYSCDGFYTGGAVAPTICCIALTNLKTQETHSFALHNYIITGKCLIDAEKELLSDFVKFYNGLKSPVFIHWHMEDLEYGFKAILARCENFGIYDLSFSKLKNISLNDYFYSSLLAILEKYQCSSVDIMNGKKESECFEKRNFNAIKLSTEAKSQGIIKFVNYALKHSIDFNDIEE